jgi:hypothetical protein
MTLKAIELPKKKKALEFFLKKSGDRKIILSSSSFTGNAINIFYTNTVNRDLSINIVISNMNEQMQ